jgi:poly-gamma-glutamate capsule biosynthesis protein CapA/YwtB (metallophosphatase superfamily)
LRLKSWRCTAQGLEVYNGHLIMYGAGDFLNDYEGIEAAEMKRRGMRDDLGLMYYADVDGATGRLERLQMVPTRLPGFWGCAS